MDSGVSGKLWVCKPRFGREGTGIQYYKPYDGEVTATPSAIKESGHQRDTELST